MNKLDSTKVKIGNLNVFSMNKDDKKAQYVKDELEYVCLIPFEKGNGFTLKSIYLLDYTEPVDGKPVKSLIIDTVDPDLDQTPYNTVMRALVEEAGVNVDSLGITENDIYYLGDIDSNFPVGAKLHCYAVDLSNKQTVEFTRNLSKNSFIKDSSSITKVDFQQIVSGDFSDSLVLAGSFLLVSYFN